VPSTRSSAEQAFLPPQATGGLLATLRNRKVSCSTKGVRFFFFMVMVVVMIMVMVMVVMMVIGAAGLTRV